MSVSELKHVEIPSTIDGLLRLMAERGASDLHLKPTRQPLLRIDGRLVPLGTEWIRAIDWLPYQRETFVTPAFAGYVSGHSVFSRAGAEVLTAITGSHFAIDTWVGLIAPASLSFPS